ncbi:alpha/beta hydrolase [Nocardioides sp.]|uniref:alpha/beta hydrolase n=1 Tax=Nocardioides sp. TaxID=35761 RepID=UPI00351616A5
MRVRSPRRTVAARALSATAVLAVATGAAGARRHLVMRRVAPALRNPWLYLPTLVNARTLPRLRRALAVTKPVADGVSMEERRIRGMDGRPDVTVVIYRPAAPGPSGAVLWLHGGGFVAGHPAGDHALASGLAAELGAVVVAVDYRLAPEHPFPAALDDVTAALDWLAASADELGVDAARIAVAGASAGGGLAACLAQRALDEGGPALVVQCLVYPMLDDRTTRSRRGAGRIAWTPAANRFGWSAYLGGRGRTAPTPPPHAVAARRDDLTGLPPAWIGVGTLDLFHDESVEYARRLGVARVPCELHVVPGMYHGADAVAPDAVAMRAFREGWVGALRESLASS